MLLPSGYLSQCLCLAVLPVKTKSRAKNGKGVAARLVSRWLLIVRAFLPLRTGPDGTCFLRAFARTRAHRSLWWRTYAPVFYLPAYGWTFSLHWFRSISDKTHLYTRTRCGHAPGRCAALQSLGAFHLSTAFCLHGLRFGFYRSALFWIRLQHAAMSTYLVLSL